MGAALVTDIFLPSVHVDCTTGNCNYNQLGCIDIECIPTGYNMPAAGQSMPQHVCRSAVQRTLIRSISAARSACICALT
jgi:hypothetical protein